MHKEIERPLRKESMMEELVQQGFDEVYRSILDKYKIESGDVPPDLAIQFDAIQRSFVKLAEAWVRWHGKEI